MTKFIISCVVIGIVALFVAYLMDRMDDKVRI